MATKQDTEPSYMTFVKWVKHYGKDKIYDSKEVEKERETIWMENLERVKQHNKEYLLGQRGYRIQQNQYSDQGHNEPGVDGALRMQVGVMQKLEELWWMSCNRPPKRVGADPILDNGHTVNQDEQPAVQRRADLRQSSRTNPEYVDWRARGCVTEVKQQHRLPVCWIFSAVSAVESHNKIVNGELFNLSVQQLVDCIPLGDREGSVYFALLYIAMYGSIRESLYPQSLKRGCCKSKEKEVAAKLVRQEYYIAVGDSEEDLETAVALNGPVCVTLKFSNMRQLRKFSEMANSEEIFNDEGIENEKNSFVYHAVLVVGYDCQVDGNGINKFWIIKNSWGRDRNTGFHKFAKVGENHSDIFLDALYPVVKRVQSTVIED